VKASEALAEKIRPPHTVVLEPKAFSVHWARRPKDAIAIGVRPIGEDEALTAMAVARSVAKEGDRTREERVERYNEELMLQAVAASLTDPNDATVPYFETPDSMVRLAFPPLTIRFLYHELEAITIGAAPSRPLATDDDVDELSFLLTDVSTFGRLSPARVRLVRRLLRFCLDEIQPETVEDDTEDEALD
jgi:hypothetical protein